MDTLSSEMGQDLGKTNSESTWLWNVTGTPRKRGFAFPLATYENKVTALPLRFRRTAALLEERAACL